MGTIRIVLADDHRLLRAGIRALLERVPGVEVVGEAADGQEALEMVERHRPDLLFCDISMPGLGGLDVISRVAGDYPETAVVILSMHGDEEYVRRAIELGARGYMLKDSDEVELGLAVRAVTSGEVYLSPRATRHLVERYRRPSGRPPAPELTPRQREVLRLIATGHPTKAIARKLGISVKTAEAHRTQLMKRLEIHDVAGLVRHAIRIGLISAD